jgi:hypothetical protein
MAERMSCLDAAMINPLSTVARWWRNWTIARMNLVALNRCGSEEEGRIAHDVGVTGSQLRAFAGKWPDSADLLSRRLVALALDRAEIRRTEPQVLQDLQRVCTMCGSGRACEHDLAGNPSDSVSRVYCPNTTTLDALTAERAKERTTSTRGT